MSILFPPRPRLGRPRFFRLTLPALLLSAACATAPPAAPPVLAPPPPVDVSDLSATLPVDPVLTVGRLANGLTYYVRENRQPEDRAELWLVVDAGSVLEEDDQRGLAHFVEHMAFNGSAHFAEAELVDYLESIGMRFGPDINAFTGFDETVYTLRVPTDRPQAMETALLILHDWASGIAFEPQAVERERGVVIEEWRLGRGAGARISERQVPLVFAGSRYAERLPIGEREVLEAATADDLRRFFRDWYRPDLMAVIAVGDFDGEAMEKAIRDRFADLENPDPPRPREVFPVPGHEETLVGIVTDPEATQTSVAVLYKLPKEAEGTVGDYRRSLIRDLHDTMLNARLAEVAERPEAPFLLGFSGSGGLIRTRDVYSQVAVVREGQVLEGLAALLTEAERLDRHGFTAGELERARKDLLRAVEQLYLERDAAYSAAYAAEYSRVFLEDEPTPGIAVEWQMVRQMLPGIELDEVNRAAAEQIGEQDRVILVTAPEKDVGRLPGEKELLAAFRAAEAQEVEPWVDVTVDQPLVPEPPAGTAVVARRQVPEVGLSIWTLGNGVEVWLKPTDFRNDQVLLSAFSPGGTSLVPLERLASARYAALLVSEMGIGAFSARELEKALAGVAVSAQPYISELEEGITGSASPADLETLFELVWLSFTAPRRDEAVFDSILSRLRGLLANRLADPETVFADAVTEAYSQGHPRRRPPSPEVLDQVDLDDALAIYRDRFGDASDFTFVLVGSFTLDGIEPLVTRWLGGLPAGGRQESFRDVGVEPPSEPVEVVVERGLEPKAAVEMAFPGEAELSTDSLHLMDSLDDLLALRLRDALREERGATYGVSVSGDLAGRPRETSEVWISFGTSPERVEELVAVVFAEIERLQNQPSSPEEVAKIQEQQRNRLSLQRHENGFWLGVLELYATYGWDPADILEREERISRLTPERLSEAARRFIDRERYLLGILRPAS